MPETLGRLQPVPLRSQWTNEAADFTPWLADTGLALLGESLGMSLELVQREQPVGPYSADLLLTNLDDGSAVVVENQIEKTDHRHLGQVIAYAAGLDAKTVVWIAATFTEEHRAALDWLNEASHEDFRFFGVEVELWRIRASPPAPRLHVVAKPNDWSRAARESRSGASTETERFRRDFWTAFLEVLRGRKGQLSGARSPSTSPWMTWGLGRSGFYVAAVGGFRDGYLQAEVVISRDHDAYERLRAQGAQIDAEVGYPLSWDFDPDRKANYARIRRDDVDLSDRTSWPPLHEWLADRLEILHRVFASRVVRLEGSDLLGAGDESIE